jgi:AcrR family transcriptional regulator
MRAVTDAVASALPAAARAFANRGLDGTRMEDIVAATGIPRPTLYYHFSSKEEILAWLLDRLLRDLAVDIGEVMDRDEPAAERLTAVVSAYLRRFAEHPELSTVLLADLGRITRIPKLAESIWASFHEPVRKLLDAGERDGSLRRVDAELTASAIFGAVTMVGLHHVVTDQPLDVPSTVAPLEDLMQRGLGTGEMTNRDSGATE